MMELLASPEAWISLLTLSILEIVLGIDNIVFLSILAGKLPPEQRPRARQIGLGCALGARILLLLTISWIIGLTKPLFTVFSVVVTGKSLVLLAGGIFLIFKATKEIHEKLEGAEHSATAEVKRANFAAIIGQIVMIDLVFSLDSVITAVGMCPYVSIMIAANVIAILIMLVAARSIAEFVERHPTVKMLALSFLLLIGFTLTVEALSVHIPKGYIYFAMFFSVFVEMLNLRSARKVKPVQLHDSPPADAVAP